MQANARTFHAFSRDHGLPDRGLFAKLAPNKVPIYSVWLVCFISGASAAFCVPAAVSVADLCGQSYAALMGLLNFASYTAVAAIFALCAMALDTR